MKAYRFYEPEEPWRLEEISRPTLGSRDVLVRIRASGICGTELHYLHGRVEPAKRKPITLGHEISGVIEEIGESVEKLEEGDRVCIHYIISCGNCVHCDQGNDNRCRNRVSIGHHVDGGFGEYIAVPERNAFKLPREIPYDQGAIVGCAVSTPFHALTIAELRPGDSVAVFGLGGVGMHAIALARVFGASKIVGVDVVDFKLRIAKELGADYTINASEEDAVKEIADLTDGWGVDVSLECAGTRKTMESAIASACGKSRYASGRAVSVAAQFQPMKVVGLREGFLKKSGDHSRDELRRVIQLVKSKRVDLSKSITHRLPFEELRKGLDILDKKEEDVLRIVVLQ